MPRLAYVNGRYVPHHTARVHIEDRGYQFADGVYEVMPIMKGQILDERQHLDRLDRSLGELSIDWPMPRASLSYHMASLARRNRVDEGIIYLQITRGVAPRQFSFPGGVRPALVMTTSRKSLAMEKEMREGVSVITIPDIRWQRRDIKSVALLPQAMGKQKAVEAGAFEAWQLDSQGFVTEGCSSNAWIVTPGGTIVTRAATNEILNGCTRRSVIHVAEELGLPLEIRPFHRDEALQAREAFLTSASTFVIPIVDVDGHPVGEGRPGPVVARLRERYTEELSAF